MKIVNLVYDKEIECFDGTLEFAGNKYDITLSDFEAREENQATTLANKIGEWIEQHWQQVKDYAALKLVPLKNESWLFEGEQPISESQLLDTIQLDGINAFPEGNFEIYFDDHELFGNNIIVVDVSSSFEITNAYVAE